MSLRSLLCAVVFALSGMIVPAYSAERPIDANIFKRTVDRLMSGKVKGYAFAIADANGVVAEAANGWAQSPGDGNLRMSIDIPAGWGSNQKVLSGIALLDLLENRSSRVSAELETPIYFFLPDKWVESYFLGDVEVTKDWIRLRDILDHTSGIAPEADKGGTHGTIIARGLAAPMLTVDFKIDKVKYNNNNYTLLLYIIPNLAYPEEVARIEEQAAGLSLKDYNVRVAHEYGKLYTRYMLEEFLPRVPGNVVGTCRPGELRGKRYAKEYDDRSDRSGRTDNAPGFCRSQGSWFYSARDMADIHRTIEFTRKFVKRSTRRLYRVTLATPRMIYASTFIHPVLSAEAGSNFKGHTGRTRFNSISATMRLPFGYVGVAVANSADIDNDDLADTLLAAFYEASRRQYEQGKDRPGSDIKPPITLLQPDPQLCARACDPNGSCEAWTYVMPGVQHPVAAKCWLKSGSPPPAPRNNPVAVSGVKGAEYGRDRPGANLDVRQIQRDDAALCRMLCGRDNKCKSWTFVPQGRQGSTARCWLKKGTPARRAAPGLISGLSP